MFTRMKKVFFYKRKSFLTDAFIVTLGTIAAQVLPLIFYPVLTRLFAPADFGVLATITAITGVLTVIVTGKYETIVLIVNDKKDTANLLIAILLISLCFLLISEILIWIFSSEISVLFNDPELRYWLFLCPILSFCIVIYQCYNEWCVKYKYFVNLSWNKITNAGAIVLSKVCLGWSACFSGGLVWGDLGGRLFSALACTLHALKKDKAVFREVSVQRMLFLLKRYKECPVYVMPAQLLNTVGGYLPVFFLAAYFSKTELGYYSMTMMLLTLPLSVVGIAIRDVFRQRASVEYMERGCCSDLYRRILIPLAGLSLLVFALLFIVAPWVFSFVLGEQWKEAGVYARVLSPMLAISFVSEVGTAMFFIAEKMKALMKWQIVYFVCSLLSLWLGVYFFHDIKYVLFCFMMGRSVVYIVSVGMTYHYALGRV